MAKYNNREIAHAFVYHTANSVEGSNYSISYDGNRLYSYSTVIARHIWNEEGAHAIMIDNHHYSATTAKHQAYLRSAIPNGTKVFGFDRDDTSLSTALSSALEAFDKQATARTHNYIDDGLSILSYLRDFYTWQGVKVDKLLIKSTSARFSYRYDDVKLTAGTSNRITKLGMAILNYFTDEDNTGESIYSEYVKTKAYQQHQDVNAQKREEEKERRAEKARQAMERAKARAEQLRRARMTDEERNKEDFAKLVSFLCGDNNTWNPGTSFTNTFGFHTAIRPTNYGGVKGFETSKGIRLTYEEGARLWNVIKAMYTANTWNPDNEHRATDRHGHGYTFEAFTAVNDDYILKAGCHKLSFWNMYQIAKAEGWSTEGVTEYEIYRLTA